MFPPSYHSGEGHDPSAYLTVWGNMGYWEGGSGVSVIIATNSHLPGQTPPEPAHPVCCAVSWEEVAMYTSPYPFNQYLLSMGSVPGTVLETGSGDQNGAALILRHSQRRKHLSKIKTVGKRLSALRRERQIHPMGFPARLSAPQSKHPVYTSLHEYPDLRA